MTDLVVHFVRVPQELHISPDAARRLVLAAGPEVSERRGRERFVSLAWLQEKIAERDAQRGGQ